MHWTIGLTDY